MEKKIYKKLEDGSWLNVVKIIFADGTVMDQDNHDFEKQGFFWSEEPPQEYLEWLRRQEHDLDSDINRANV